MAAPAAALPPRGVASCSASATGSSDKAPSDKASLGKEPLGKGPLGKGPLGKASSGKASLGHPSAAAAVLGADLLQEPAMPQSSVRKQGGADVPRTSPAPGPACLLEGFVALLTLLGLRGCFSTTP